MKFMFVFALQVVLGMLIAYSTSLADEAGRSTDKLRLDKEQMNRWIEFYQSEAEEYDIFLGEDRSAKLKLRREPVFRWVSPDVSNEFNGAVFVWTQDGRPGAVGSIWSKSAIEVRGKRTICHSFHSLAPGPLHADRKGESWWYPTKAGIQPRLIPDSPVPAKSARLRLTQMRALAREFTVSQFTDRAETKRATLRLLPQAVYRYESNSDDSPDGGIFVFLRNWDPEILLLIETRETAVGPRWHYAPIRFCSATAHVKHKNKDVWVYEKGGPTRDPEHYYFTAKGASYVDRYFDLENKKKP